MAESGERRVYLLSPRRLSPETIAVTFAKTSRSPLSFEEIAAELTDERSAEFHEKWVVGYGHASVAEHAVLHIAFENISRLAVEAIESQRLASYTEKSTRYQQWEPGSYHTPVEVVGTPHEPIYREICDRLFGLYRESLEAVRAAVRRQAPRREGESDERWDGRIRSRYVDACRFLLPAAARANLGMTANARVLEHAIRKMLAHPLAEVRAIGEELKHVARGEVPTLLKYADPSETMLATARGLRAAAVGIPAEAGGEWLRLVAFDPDGEAKVLAAALAAESSAGFETVLEQIRRASAEKRTAMADALLGNLGRFDPPGRALEHTAYTFEAVLDQGAYFELKRHRIMTQTPQRLTAHLGFTVPRLIAEAGLESGYRSAMQAAAEAWERLSVWNPDVAAYVVPNGFNRRVLMSLNLREAFHLCELRSAANAHFSIRRLALRMAELIREVHPLLSRYMRLPQDTTWRDIEREHFVQL